MMSDSQLDSLLAQRQATDREIVDVDEPTVKLVIFSLDERYFAFSGVAIREVLPGSEPVYFVPGMPPSVEGVMNVRGDIESVIGLYSLLQLSGRIENTSRSSILLGRGGQMHSGLRVDQLLDVVDVVQSQIQEPPESLPAHLQPFVTGLLQFKGKAVALLDLDAVFTAWKRGQG